MPICKFKTTQKIIIEATQSKINTQTNYPKKVYDLLTFVQALSIPHTH